MNDVPILITGADRSGTSLLYAIVASHPDVAMIRRSNVWRWLDGAFGPLDRPESLDRCLDQIARYQRLQVLHPDPAAIRFEFMQGEPTYGRLFSIMFRQHAQREEKTRWGDKSLHTELVAERVFEEWPSARIVQLVRDPRDRYASVVKRYPDRRKGGGAIVGSWLRSTDAAIRNLEAHPGAYMVVRYETLASSPESTVREVCAFLGLEFVPEMLEMRAVEEQREAGGNSSFGGYEPGTISTRSVGRFRQVLDARTVQAIESVCDTRMARFDYELDTPRSSRSARVRLVDGPLLWSRSTMWRRLDSERRESNGVPEHRLSESATASGEA